MSEYEFSAEDCAVAGITQDVAQDLYSWILPRVGVISGRNGPLGSGIFVRTTAHQTAILTARHVAMVALMTGEIAVASRRVARAELSNAVRVSCLCDAAIILVSEYLAPEYLDPTAWSSVATPNDRLLGQFAIASGLPGGLTSGVDVERGIVEEVTTVQLLTHVVRVDEDVFAMPATASAIPDSLWGGMSGGPVFDMKKQLLGVCVQQTLGSVEERDLLAIPRCWRDLGEFNVFPQGVEPPRDARGQRVVQRFDLEGCPIRTVTFSGHLIWSESDPGHRLGGCGTIDEAEFESDVAAISVGMKTLIYLPMDSTEAERHATFESECKAALHAILPAVWRDRFGFP